MDINKNETLVAKKTTNGNKQEKKTKKEKANESKKRKRAEKVERKKKNKLLKTEKGPVQVIHQSGELQNGETQRRASGGLTAKSPKCRDDAEFIKTFCETHAISVDGPIKFKPFETFEEAGFPEDLLKVTSEYSKPTPIQSQCWPILLANRDIVDIAKTGSGKTLAFGLPGLLHVKNHLTPQKRKPTLMLVIAPTRELAQQTDTVLKAAGKAINISVVCVHGGVAKRPQQDALWEGAHVLVATPGRLLDLVGEGSCDLSEVTYLVLDEADRMLDMGFEKDIRQILEYLPPQRQTAMFSATWPAAIQKLSAQFLNDPIHVTVGACSDGLSANQEITQIVEVIDDRARNDRLTALLKDYHHSRKNRILVFVLFKKEATRLEDYLLHRGWKVASIHSDKTQAARTKALQGFIDGTSPLLVATDVAARGLDIPQVEYVINYSFPLTIEDYIHRIGRTGRAGKTGISHTFFQHHDKHRAGELVNVLKETNQVIPEGLGQWGLAVKKKEPKLGRIEIVEPSAGHITFDSDDE